MVPPIENGKWIITGGTTLLQGIPANGWRLGHKESPVVGRSARSVAAAEMWAWWNAKTIGTDSRVIERTNGTERRMHP